MISGGRNERGAPAAVVKQIREKPDQTQKRQRNERAYRADRHRQCRDRQHTKRGRKISQLFILASCPLVFVMVRRTTLLNVILLNLIHAFLPILSAIER